MCTLRFHSIWAVTVFFVAFATACGKSGVGEACSKPGDTGECVDNAICTKDSSSVVCRKLCKEQADCGPNESCNGVSGTNVKSCQPETTK